MDQPFGRECRKNFSPGFGFSLVKCLSPGVLTLLFFLPFHARTRAPNDINREALSGRRRVGMAWARGQTVPAQVCQSRGRAGTRGRRACEDLKWPMSGPMQSQQGEGGNRYWGSLSTFYHTLFPRMPSLFIQFQPARNQTDTPTPPFPWHLYPT